MRNRSLLLALVLAGSTQATTYHIAATGNDAAAGTSPGTAWRTIAKVNTQMLVSGFFQAGDQILFRRGDVFVGTLRPRQLQGTAAQPIVFGAYGSGAAPVLSGAKPFTGWTVHSGSIWKCSTAPTDSITQLFSNGSLLTLARTPNVGQFIVDARTSGGVGFSDTDLGGQAAGHWSGATVVLRAARYTIERLRVASSSGNQLVFAQASQYGDWNDNGWGYHLENKLSMLDAPGEWFHDTAADLLYVRLPGNADPNTAVIQGSVLANVVFFEDPWPGNVHVRVQDLVIERSADTGVFGEYAGDHITLAGCTLRWNALNGAVLNLMNPVRFTGCTITDSRDNGVGIHNGGGYTVEQCTIRRIREGSGVNIYGLASLLVNDTVRANTIDSVGHIGISLYGSGHLAERNVVSNGMLLLDDGALIYSYKSGPNITIRDNILRTAHSSTAGIPDAYGSSGIYLDEGSHDFIVQRNTVSDCDVGILLNNGAHHNTLQQNVVHGCRDEQLRVQCVDLGPASWVPHHNTFSGNVLFSTSPEALVVRLISFKDSIPHGTYSGNRWFQPYRSDWFHAVRQPANGNAPFGLTGRIAAWTALTAETGAPRQSFVLKPYYTSVQPTGPNLVTNTPMNSTASWSAFPSGPANITLTSVGGELQVAYSPGSTNGSGITFGPDFAVNGGQLYRISVKKRGVQDNAITLGLRRTTPYGSIGGPVPLRLATTNSTSSFFVKPSTGVPNARIQFDHGRLSGTFWLDDVTCEPVSAIEDDAVGNFPLLVNATAAPVNVPLNASYLTTDSTLVQGSILLQPYSSVALVRATAVPGTVQVRVKAWLDGAYDSNTNAHRDDLRTAGLVPATEPNTTLGQMQVLGGGEQVTAAVLARTGPDAVVDWVTIELRSNTAPTQVLATRNALIQRDGDVVDVDGSSAVGFLLAPGNYRVALRHRNHLGVMTAGAFALSATPVNVDFTLATTSTYGTNAQKVVGTDQRALWSGNVQRDGLLKYTGANNDRDPILLRIGGTPPTNTTNGYWPEDVTMDGVVKYTGTNNDRDPILVNIGGTVPTNIRAEQLP